MTDQIEANQQDIQELRDHFHAKVDQLFEHINTGLQVEWGCLQLAGELINGARAWIDRQVGRDFSQEALKSSDEAERIGQEKRELVSAAANEVDGQSSESTAEAGRTGTAILIQNLATFTNDPYLKHLADALQKLRYGQAHPWLNPVRAVANPASHALAIMRLRGIPFAVIEYLVASGACETKTEAEGLVLDALSIEKDAFDAWRKRQNVVRRHEFHTEMDAARIVGKGLRSRRGAHQPELRALVDYHDQLFGIAAVHRCKVALDERTKTHGNDM